MSPSLSWIDPERLKRSWARASSDVGHEPVRLDGDWVHFDAPMVASSVPATDATGSDATEPPPTALPQSAHLEAASMTPPTHLEAMPGPTAVPNAPPPPLRPEAKPVVRELRFPPDETTTPLASATSLAGPPMEPPTQFTSRRPSSNTKSARPTVTPEAVADLALEVESQMSVGPTSFEALPPVGLARLPAVKAPDLPEFGNEPFIALRVPVFTAWLEQFALPISYYVTDAHGLPIHLEGMSETQAVAAVALARSLKPLRRIIGSDRFSAVTLTTADARVLHTVWAETPLGRMAVGMEASEPLNAKQLHSIGRALRGVFEGGLSQ